MRAAAIVVAGGTGTRMGRPKQFLPLGPRPVVEWAIEAFLKIPDFERVVVVLSPENVKEHGGRLASGRVMVTEGGATRMGSVRKGFALVPEEFDVVAVHDGARPLVTPEIILEVLEEAATSGAALAAVQVKDTLKKVTSKDLWISSTPARSHFWQAQTPQCYRREILEDALDRFADEKDATDESQLVEKTGRKVRVVPSSYENIKITTPEDLAMAEAILVSRLGLRRRQATGFGYDIHRLEAGRPLILAGVGLEHPRGLVGHSDGDVALHAAGDAVLGALGGGDIGMMFPSDNPRIKGIASRDIIAAVMAKVMTANAELVHLDLTLVAEEPRLLPHYEAFRMSLSHLFSLPPERVSVKAKSHEGFDAIGQGRAIACYAVASVSLPG